MLPAGKHYSACSKSLKQSEQSLSSTFITFWMIRLQWVASEFVHPLRDLRDTQKYPNQPLFALFPVVLSPCYIVHPFSIFFMLHPHLKDQLFFHNPCEVGHRLKLPILSGMPSQFLQRVSLLLERRVLHPYTVLFEEGEVGSTMVPWLILVDPIDPVPMFSNGWSWATSQVGSNMQQSSFIRWSSMWGRRTSCSEASR